MTTSLVRSLAAAVALAAPLAAGDAFAEIGGFTLSGRYILIPPEFQGESLPTSFDPNLPQGFDRATDTDLVALLSNGTDIGDVFTESTIETAIVELSNGNYGFIGDVLHTYVGTEPLDATNLALVQHITSETLGGLSFRVQAVSPADPDFAVTAIVQGADTFDGIAPKLGFVVEDVPLDPLPDTIADYPLRAWTDIFAGTIQPDDEFVVTWLYDLGVSFAVTDEDLDVDDGELAVLSPGSAAPNPEVDGLVGFTNSSGTDDATVTVLKTAADLHPDTEGFGLFGTNLVVETSLPDGEFAMTITVPFSDDVLGGADPTLLDLAYFDTATQSWELAVSGNTQASPGHPGPVGDRYVVTGVVTPSPLVPSFELGDYGVFWNTATESGFVWAQVDHTTEFVAATFGVQPIGCGYNPPGSLAFAGGSPQLGKTLELRIDDPVGVVAPAAVAVLLVSLQPDLGAPCGTLLPGYGMGGAFAELSIGLLPPDPIATVGPLAWGGTGVGSVVVLNIPDDPSLSGLELYTQGALVAPEGAMFSEGLLVKLAP